MKRVGNRQYVAYLLCSCLHAVSYKGLDASFVKVLQYLGGWTCSGTISLSGERSYHCVELDLGLVKQLPCMAQPAP